MGRWDGRLEGDHAVRMDVGGVIAIAETVAGDVVAAADGDEAGV